MAEARSIRTVGDELKRGVQLSVSEDGVHVDLSFTIPPFRKGLRQLGTRLAHLQRRMIYALWPWGLWLFGTVVTVVTVGVVMADRESWWRSGWLATLVWNLSQWFPWVDVPLPVRVGVLAAWTAVGGAILLAFGQRLLLRLLFSYHQPLYESMHPSLVTKVWAMAVHAASGWTPKPMTYSFQSSLPALPLPSLERTVWKYVEQASLIKTDPAEQAKLRKLAEDFLAKEGPTLQWYLRGKWLMSSNYVTDWWEKYVYLRGRSPIVINSNYYVHDSAWLRLTTRQASRAATVSASFLRFFQELEAEQLEPIMLPTGVPLCMDQYRRIFGTTRIPGREIDEIVHFDEEESQHIAVYSRGHMYKVPVFKSNGAQVTPQELESIFDEIIEASSKDKADAHEAAIPALTGQNRTVWAEARENFFSAGVNRQSLYAIESALFFVVLDEESHDLLQWTERSRALMHGSGRNRWFDKSVSLIFFADGKMGLNVEHSWADAPVIAHVMEAAMLVAEKTWQPYDDKTGFVRADFRMPLPTNVAGAADPCDARARLAPYRKLEWQLSRRAEEVIAEAERSVQALAADLDLHVVGHGLYGKRFMKACKVSPDAYIQMAMQLAYFRDAGRFAATYESSMTRLFFQGRTETIRPLSKESCEFVRLMEDKTATPAAKLAALQAAEHVHKVKTADAMSGKGIDRHLFALYIVSVGKGIDAPFLQTALGEPWRLSTSQQPQQQTKLWDLRRDDDARRISPGGGFGPVADDGYGVSYMVAGEDAIFFHVSSKKSNPATDSARFIHHLFRAMREMRDILKSALKEEERDKALKRGASLGPLPLLPPCPAGVHGVPLDQSEDK